jgi:hypothetical protein
MGSLSSRVLRHPGRARAQEETGPGVGGSARRPETGGDAAGHGFCYCPGSRKRKRSSGAFCYCHPDSETEEEEEGDEQQRLLNTPRRYVRGCSQVDPHLHLLGLGTCLVPLLVGCGFPSLLRGDVSLTG